MKSLLLVLLFFVFSCSSDQAHQNLISSLKIEEVQPNKFTGLTKQNLIHLAQVYHLDSFIYTKVIRIQPKGEAYSHPVLTLNTKYAEQPNMLLAAFLHEEFHWWLSFHEKSFQDATAQLRKKYPGKSKDDYAHIVVCFLEYKALVKLLEVKEAKKVISILTKRDQTRPWTYNLVLTQFKVLQKIFKNHKLIPPELY